jgi:hypothetical protein
MEFIYWTWSKKGEHLEKSYKSQHPQMKVEVKKKTPPSDTSLEAQIVNEAMFTEDNKREVNYDRLSKRKLVTNRKINPYLTTNDYLNDITVQDQFLRPKNSNFNVSNKDLNDN